MYHLEFTSNFGVVGTASAKGLEPCVLEAFHLLSKGDSGNCKRWDKGYLRVTFSRPLAHY